MISQFEHVQVQVLPSGIVRVYGNGGMVYELKGKYVCVESIIDSVSPAPSGQLPKKNT